MNSLLNSKYTGYTFYVHKFANYDSVFILKALISENNNRKEDDKYKINTL